MIRLLMPNRFAASLFIVIVLASPAAGHLNESLQHLIRIETMRKRISVLEAELQNARERLQQKTDELSICSNSLAFGQCGLRRGKDLPSLLPESQANLKMVDDSLELLNGSRRLNQDILPLDAHFVEGGGLLLKATVPPFEGRVIGSVYSCPDGSPTQWDGDPCPGARKCDDFDCSAFYPGYTNITERRVDDYCLKYGCRTTCCTLLCSLLDGQKDECDKNQHCVYDTTGNNDWPADNTNRCRHRPDCKMGETDDKKLIWASAKGMGSNVYQDTIAEVVPDFALGVRQLISRYKKQRVDDANLLEGLKVLVIADACYPQLVTDKSWHGAEDWRYQLTCMQDNSKWNQGGTFGLKVEQVYDISLFDANFDPGSRCEGRKKPSKFTKGMGERKYKTAGELLDFQSMLLAREAVVPWKSSEKNKEHEFEHEEVLHEAVEHIRSNRYSPPDEIRKAWNLKPPPADYSARELLEAADVVAINGGNTEFLNWVLKANEDFTSTLKKRVEAGQTVLITRSAGSFVTGKAITMSVEEGSRSLIPCDPKTGWLDESAMGLLGDCTVRAHYNAERWDVAVTILERTKFTRVLRIPNGEAVQCMGGICRVFGEKRQLGHSVYPIFGPMYSDRDCKREEPQNVSIIVILVICALTCSLATIVALYNCFRRDSVRQLPNRNSAVSGVEMTGFVKA